jgi:hypothetical protein
MKPWPCERVLRKGSGSGLDTHLVTPDAVQDSVHASKPYQTRKLESDDALRNTLGSDCYNRKHNSPGNFHLRWVPNPARGLLGMNWLEPLI